jgi:hypothetical protein
MGASDKYCGKQIKYYVLKYKSVKAETSIFIHSEQAQSSMYSLSRC